ncbi:MAG: HAMP domain-containing histidine kinase [Paludibacteraceae bacterium]|nr:HAMP domain-containing histidine kinase [Paludibacteraceae bacterium]
MRNNKARTILLLVAFVIVGGSVMFTNNLANRLADEEKKKIEIWAGATRQLVLADENTDIEFVSSIIERNTTIPVYMVDSKDSLLLSRNVREPKTNVERFYAKRIQRLKESQEPIEVRISKDVVQYIYYEDSTLLRQLQWFPYVQFAIIFVFIVVILFALQTAQRSEQNRVWVGLSKETAHQLGTPISSLNGWVELLQMNYPDDTLIPQMQQDVTRLQTIAERFSKVGSVPDLERANVTEVVKDTIEYMKHRTSQKITYVVRSEDELYAFISRPLLGWVVENLCKNAVDAMDGQGTLTIDITSDEQKIFIDITDTGKGLERGMFRTIFTPGYTSKARGWGLGLSLSKRIIDDYHKGKIYVLRSEIGHGTTFRIRLPKNNA